jgi:hypothetical protein
MQVPQHRRALATLAAVMAACIFPACVSTRPPAQSMRDPQADFSSLTTFAWDDPRQAQAETPPLSILDSSIRAAIAAELQRKGYSQAQAGATPRLLLHYETAAAEKIKSNPFRLGIGVGGYGSSGGASVGMSTPAARDVREGTLVLRAVDPARNVEVWNGRVSRELGKGGPPDPVLINSAVKELLQEFPARTGTAQ